MPRRQEGGGSKEGSGFERALGAVDKAVGNATGTVKGTIDNVDDALGGATRKVGETIGKPDETAEGAEDVKDGAEGAVKGAEDEAEGLGEQAPFEIPVFAPSVTVKVVDLFEGPFTVSARNRQASREPGLNRQGD